jgi:hypothetical protein
MEIPSQEDWITAFWQGIVAVLTAVAAIIGLRKDLFNKKERKLRKSAIRSILLILIASVVSCYLIYKQTDKTIFDKTQLQTEKSEETKRFNNLSLLAQQLRKDNEALTKKLEVSTDTLLSQAAVESLNASRQLRGSTERIEEAVFGGKGLIHLKLQAELDKKHLHLELSNPNKYPQYDVSITCYDYNELIKCARIKDDNTWIVDFNCSENSKFQSPDLNMNANATVAFEKQIPFPFNSNLKFYFFIQSRSLSYIQELFSNNMGQCYRLFKFDIKTRRKTIIKISNPNNMNINWEKEFSFPPVFNNGNIQLTSNMQNN